MKPSLSIRIFDIPILIKYFQYLLLIFIGLYFNSCCDEDPKIYSFKMIEPVEAEGIIDGKNIYLEVEENTDLSEVMIDASFDGPISPDINNPINFSNGPVQFMVGANTKCANTYTVNIEQKRDTTTIQGSEDPPERNNISFKGEVEDMPNENKTRVKNGEISFKICDKEIKFEVADATVEFDDQDLIKNISGTLKIPSPSDCIKFDDFAETNIGFLSGSEINKLYPQPVGFIPENNYLVFYVKVNLAFSVCTGGVFSEPIKIDPPLGGEIILVGDYCDPMVYFAGHLETGQRLATGYSAKGQFEFIPNEALPGYEPFLGKSVRSGRLTLLNSLYGDFTYVQNKSIDADFVLNDPLSSKLDLSYKAGFNGKIGVRAPVKDVADINLPSFSASGYVGMRAGTSGVHARIAVNGVIGSEDDWLPGFVPIRPIASLRLKGMIDSEGPFSLELIGKLGIGVLKEEWGLEGALKLENEAFTASGSFEAPEGNYTIEAVVERDQTTVRAIFPPLVIGKFVDLKSVKEKLDTDLSAIIQRENELAAAVGDYEIALSLDGLRAQLPGITQQARAAMNRNIKDAKSIARSRVDSEIKKNLPFGAKVCRLNNLYGQINTQIDNQARPFYQALDRLERAVSDNNDNEQTRKELESALRNLISKRSIPEGSRKKFTVHVGVFCIAPTPINIYVSVPPFAIKVLDNKQVALLTEAADKVKFIKEKEDRVIQLREILIGLPTQKDVGRVLDCFADGVYAGIKIGGVGFILPSDDSSAVMQLLINGTWINLGTDSNGVSLSDGLEHLVKDLSGYITESLIKNDCALIP